MRNELRIGNLITFLEEGVPSLILVRIVAIEGASVRTLDVTKNSNEEGRWRIIPIEKAIPIKATESILIILGFRKRTYGYHKVCGPCRVSVFFTGYPGDEPPYVCLNENEYLSHIKHVHSVQNLCFLLSGEDLKIQGIKKPQETKQLKSGK